MSIENYYYLKIREILKKKKQPEKKGEGRVIIKLKRIRITSSINYNGKLIIKLDFFW